MYWSHDPPACLPEHPDGAGSSGALACLAPEEVDSVAMRSGSNAGELTEHRAVMLVVCLNPNPTVCALGDRPVSLMLTLEPMPLLGRE